MSPRYHQPMASPTPLWIKICANTTLDDALLAADLGADAVGFVFAPSKRQVTSAQVAAIAPRLPSQVERVGVFTGSTSGDLTLIAQAAEQSGITAIQLHGGIDSLFVERLRHRLGPAFSIIQSAHWTIHENDASAQRLTPQLAELAVAHSPDRLLLDAKLGAASGGLGLAFDWSCAQPSLATQPQLRIIVAGGLRPDNVAQAIAQLKPYGVDVASGVEQSPGKKDPAKLKAFIQAARGAI
jgi:phosphoribosylanthranilate isomerase